MACIIIIVKAMEDVLACSEGTAYLGKILWN